MPQDFIVFKVVLVSVLTMYFGVISQSRHYTSVTEAILQNVGKKWHGSTKNDQWRN